MEEIPSGSKKDKKGKKGKKSMKGKQIESKTEPVIEALYDGTTPFEEAAAPCGKPAPCEADLTFSGEPPSCEAVVVPCDEPAPCEAVVAFSDEPVVCETAAVSFDWFAPEGTSTKTKKGKIWKKVIEASIATDPEPGPVLESVPETEPKIESEKNRDLLRQISLCLVGNHMTDEDKCEIIEKIIRS